MTSLKRIALFLVLSVVVTCLMVFFVTTFGYSQPAASSTLKIKVLRPKGQSHVKPTKEEVAIARGQAKEERSLEDKIPTHLPIKVKIKADKEKAFKDAANPQWAHNLELEVTNTGTKPIYFLVLLVTLPEPEIREGRILFPVRYGRTDFSMFNETLERATADDVPIKPGESYILKINDGNRIAFERFQAKQGWPNPKKLVVEFEQLNFGDGTGFRWIEGVAWPPADKKTSLNGCRPYSKNSGAKAHHAQAKFWNIKPAPAPDCCPNGCAWVKEYDTRTACYATIDCNVHRVDVLPCGEPGKCRKVEWTSQTCIVFENGYDYEHECPHAKTFDCGTATPTPPPPPNPPPGSGLGGGSGNEGGTPYGCTDYYWYWFISYDGGHTWELSAVDYAGCW